MKRASLAIATLVLMSTFYLTLTILPKNAEATTLYVGGGGPGNHTKIQDAIDAANPGDTIYVYSGIYYEHVTIDKSLSLVGENRDTTIINGSGTGDVARVTAHWVNLSGFTITNSGDVTNPSWDSGLELWYVNNCNITNNNVFRNNLRGIYSYASDNNTFTYNNVSRNAWEAFYLHYSDHNVLNNNTVYNPSYGYGTSGIRLEWSDDNTITNNTVHGILGGAISLNSSSHNLLAFNTVTLQGSGMAFRHSHDNTIIGNYISSKVDEFLFGGITISGSTSHILADNVMVGDGLIVDGSLFGSSSLAHWNTHVIDTSNSVNGRPVYYWKNITGGMVPLGASEVILANCTGVVVENLNLDNGTAGIELGFSSNITVSNNTVWGSKRGIYLYDSDNNAIAGNTVSFANSRGIYLIFSNRSTISDNDLWGNQNGVSLRDSDNNSVTENNIWDNTRSGISIGPDFKFGPGSDNNIIVNNAFFTNRDGISFYQSYNNSVSQNGFVNNINGVYVLDAGGNRIHHNNFIDNTQQAFDDGSTNQWDDGYPSGGNFWNDYSGVDVFNGPNQDIPGIDWIGDTPYVIDFNSEDRYPLVSPFLTFLLVPSAPRNLQAAPGDQQVTLTWIAPSFDGGSPITNYRIYRGTTSGGEIFYTQIGNTLTFPDMGLMNGQLYCYRVSAVNGVGEGPMSNEACATTPTITPGAPVILQADLSGNGLENVTVKWNLSSDDGAGQNSVVGYSIYRGTTHDANALGYLLIATVPSGTIEYNDDMTGEGDPNNYFYQICAVDLNSLTNCSVNQAGKFTRSLMGGPNLVSIPLIQYDENMETVLQTVKWDKAWTYDSSVQRWKSQMMFKPYKGDLEEVNLTMGIWVNVMEQSNLTVAGVVPSTTSIYLQAGWNLVAFPSFNLTYLAGDLKAETGATRVEGFDPSAPPYFLRALADGDSLRTGFGYWMSVVSETSWTIDNS